MAWLGSHVLDTRQELLTTKEFYKGKKKIIFPREFVDSNDGPEIKYMQQNKCNEWIYVCNSSG